MGTGSSAADHVPAALRRTSERRKSNHNRRGPFTADKGDPHVPQAPCGEATLQGSHEHPATETVSTTTACVAAERALKPPPQGGRKDADGTHTQGPGYGRARRYGLDAEPPGRVDGLGGLGSRRHVR